MTRAILMGLAAACLFGAVPLNFHWFAAGASWAGWASSGCATVAVFLFTLAKLMP